MPRKMNQEATVIPQTQEARAANQGGGGRPGGKGGWEARPAWPLGRLQRGRQEGPRAASGGGQGTPAPARAPRPEPSPSGFLDAPARAWILLMEDKPRQRASTASLSWS